MKKNYLVIAFISLSICVNAQITLTNTINSLSPVSQSIWNTNCIYYAPDSNTLKIFDENFVLEKTISNLPTFSSVGLMSKNLFSLNNKYDFMLTIRNATTNTYECKLYNEDKQLLFNFGELSPWMIFVNNFGELSPWIVVNNKLFANKLEVVNNHYNYTTKIYNLPGQLNSSSELIVNTSNSFAFPNPSENVININYNTNKMEEMHIIDLNGNIIENYLLDPSLKTIQINVSNYSKGIYIYRLGDTTGKFIVK
ncbi:MAG: T9SS type A sorting domain-containing protein [Bacteroidales bacterium]